MPEHFDSLETRGPAAREQDLFARLPAQIARAVGAPGWAKHLAGIDPRSITSRAALAKLPLLRKSALLGLLGGIVGVAIGAAGARLLGNTPAVRGLLEPDLSVALLGLCAIIAIGVGVVSGLYPAWRSSRLTPSLALQSV